MYIHDATEQAYKNGYAKGFEDGKKFTENQSKGEWIGIPSLIGIPDWKFSCSLCGAIENYQRVYCPDCGKPMRVTNNQDVIYETR